MYMVPVTDKTKLYTVLLSLQGDLYADNLLLGALVDGTPPISQ